MTNDVLVEIKDFFAFLTGIFQSIMEMFSSLFGGAADEESSETAA